MNSNYLDYFYRIKNSKKNSIIYTILMTISFSFIFLCFILIVDGIKTPKNEKELVYGAILGILGIFLLIFGIIYNLKTKVRHVKFIRQKTWNSVSESILKWINIVLMLILCASLLLLPIWMIFNSLKTPLEYMRNTFSFPISMVFKNYTNVLSKLYCKVGPKKVYMPTLMWNSLSYSLLYPFWGVFWTVMVAYVFAFYKFKLNKFLYNLGIIIMIFPIIGGAPTAMVIKRAIGAYDNMLYMMLIAPATLFSGLNFMIVHAAFKSLSYSYAEAAFIDGANHWQVLFKIYFPMILPTAVMFFVLGFMSAWNDYGMFLLWLPSTPNIALGLYFFNSNAPIYDATKPEVLAGYSVVVVPTVIMFLLSQNIIFSKFTVGGLKG